MQDVNQFHQGRTLLNVGGNDREIPIPAQYNGWRHLLLDIDPQVRPDVICDARTLTNLPPHEYDAIYCAHNLEHYYRHEVPKVLAGFIHLLKEGGFVEIHVPDIGEVMRIAVSDNLDIDDTLYQSSAGPITVADVIYGYGPEIEKSGQDFMAHKTGFSAKTIQHALQASGFRYVFIAKINLEVRALAFRNKPGQYAQELFNLPAL